MSPSSAPPGPSPPGEPRRNRLSLALPGGEATGLPPVTLAILFVLVVAYGLEIAVSRSFDPDPEMLMALGGMNTVAVHQGDWFRLLTASLLHGGVVHLLLNGVALYLGGLATEALAGRGWMFVIYAASALGGSLLGLVLNDASVVSVGASGAIMGLLAASFVLTFRLPKGRERVTLQIQLGQFLIPTLIPHADRVVSSAMDAGKVDYSAHLGGALAGLVLGLLLLALRRHDGPPPLRRASDGLAVILALAFVVASAGVARTYPERAASARLKADDLLVADGAIPVKTSEAEDTVETWGRDRPRDPRVHLYRGMKLVNGGDLPGGERELRAGLSEREILAKFFEDRHLEIMLRGLLSATLIEEGRPADAAREAAPVCHAETDGGVPDILQRLELCGAHAPEDPSPP